MSRWIEVRLAASLRTREPAPRRAAARMLSSLNSFSPSTVKVIKVDCSERIVWVRSALKIVFFCVLTVCRKELTLSVGVRLYTAPALELLTVPSKLSPTRAKRGAIFFLATTAGSIEPVKGL